MSTTPSTSTQQPGDVVAGWVLGRDGVWQPAASRRSDNVFALLALFLAGIGAHRLYLKQYAPAALFLVGSLVGVFFFHPAGWVTAVWALVDLVRTKQIVRAHNEALTS